MTIVKLTKEQLEQKEQFIKEYMTANNASDGSAVDANANVDCKNVATLAGEIHKDFNIQIKRYLVSKKIAAMFGEDLAKEYNRQLENHEIYAHDETHFDKPYCCSITMYPFLLDGLKGLGGESKAPKHLASFCGNFINLVFALTSQIAGAIATVEFLGYMDKFARDDYGDDYLKTHTSIIDNCLQQVVYSLNQPASARDYQCPFWNISIFDRPYFEAIFGDFAFPDGSKMNYDSVAKLQRHFMDWFNNERTKAVLTFPVVTAAMLSENNEPKDKEFENMCAEQLSKGNSFFIYMSDNASALSSCCRLRNEMQDNTFSYSLGAGGVATGSMNVITLNVNRFIQNCKGFDETKLREQIEKIHKYQVATKAYIKDYVDANMTPLYKQHYITMDKQYLTIGINGLVEGAEYLGLKANNNPEYMAFVNKFLNIVYNTNKDGRQQYKVMFNVEFVPAEGLGVKNYNWDKKDGYVVNPNRNCYNSYMYAVEDESITPIDKFILHGKNNLQYLDGGSALHLNLEEYPTKEGYKKLFNIAAQTGCNYWTTNVKITCCEDCGHIDKHTLHKCPKCGSKNITYATRIIGYLKKISAFSSPRQREEAMRYYHKSNI